MTCLIFIIWVSFFIFLGISNENTSLNARWAPLCLYYSRTSATAYEVPSLLIAAFYGNYTTDGTQVQCPETAPSYDTMIFGLSKLYCSGDANQYYSCVTDPYSRCINDTRVTFNIGVGMSVGGIFLLLVTLFFMIVIQQFTKPGEFK